MVPGLRRGRIERMTRRSAPGLGCLVLGLLILGGMSISFFANGQWVSGIMFGVGTIVVAASVIARVVLGAAQIRRFFRRR
jgi:protein-S-isoprenylcysteine O-methyltransferase Ste14